MTTDELTPWDEWAESPLSEDDEPDPIEEIPSVIVSVSPRGTTNGRAENMLVYGIERRRTTQERLDFYGLETATQCGVTYALCPVCKNGYVTIEDALKCCKDEDAKESDDDERTNAIMLSAFSLVRRKMKYAVVATNIYKFRQWTRMFGVPPHNAVFVTESTLNVIPSNYQIIFAGRASALESLPVMKDERIRNEYVRQSASIQSFTLKDGALFYGEESGEVYKEKDFIDGKPVLLKTCDNRIRNLPK